MNAVDVADLFKVLARIANGLDNLNQHMITHTQALEEILANQALPAGVVLKRPPRRSGSST